MLPATLLPMLRNDSKKVYPYTTVDDLFGGPFQELSDFETFVQRFNFLIVHPDRLTESTLEYLTSEGGLVESDGPLDYHHRDHWLNKILRENLEITGRLPWGESEPENFGEADPLGLALVAGTSTRRPDVIIVDPQGANHGNRILFLGETEEDSFEHVGREASSVAFASESLFLGSVRREDGHCESS